MLFWIILLIRQLGFDVIVYISCCSYICTGIVVLLPVLVVTKLKDFELGDM